MGQLQKGAPAAENGAATLQPIISKRARAHTREDDVGGRKGNRRDESRAYLALQPLLQSLRSPVMVASLALSLGHVRAYRGPHTEWSALRAALAHGPSVGVSVLCRSVPVARGWLHAT
jgi:hypothetical protein